MTSAAAECDHSQYEDRDFEKDRLAAHSSRTAEVEAIIKIGTNRNSNSEIQIGNRNFGKEDTGRHAEN